MTDTLRQPARQRTTSQKALATATKFLVTMFSAALFSVTLFSITLLGGQVALAQSAGKPAATVSSTKSPPLKLGVTFTAHSMLGALVMDVLPGSPAAKAGLQPGDRILEANGRPISGAEDAVQLVGQLGLNSPLHMLISREGRRRVLETTLTSWKSNVPATTGGGPAPNYYAPFPQGFPFQLTPADIDDQHAYGG